MHSKEDFSLIGTLIAVAIIAIIAAIAVPSVLKARAVSHFPQVFDGITAENDLACTAAKPAVLAKFDELQKKVDFAKGEQAILAAQDELDRAESVAWHACGIVVAEDRKAAENPNPKLQ